jgi:hypothetical protein
MPQRIVDGLEEVEIGEQQRGVLALPNACREGAAQLLTEEDAIRECKSWRAMWLMRASTCRKCSPIHKVLAQNADWAASRWRAGQLLSGLLRPHRHQAATAIAGARFSVS